MMLDLSRLAATAIVLAVLLPAVPAVAAPLSGIPGARPISDDVSSAKRYRRYGHRYIVRPAPYQYSYRRGFGADPSIGPGGRPYPRPTNMGGCVFDEGYGRFSACPNR